MRRGAYGLHLAGLSSLDELLVEAAPGWPTTEIAVERGSIEGLTERLDESSGTIVFRDAVARVERTPPGAVFRFAAEPVPDAIVHPYLAPVAGLLAHWRGREALHAGAFVHQGAAWGLVAERGGGKSSTLARLALDGLPVIADDLLVIDDLHALAAPRAVDLRRVGRARHPSSRPRRVSSARKLSTSRAASASSTSNSASRRPTSS